MVPVHPLVVHFPVALLIGAAVLYLLGLLIKKSSFEQAAWYMHLGGFAGAILAFFTGNAAEKNVAMTHEIHEMIERHETLGQLAMFLFGLMAVWYFLRQNKQKQIEKIFFVFLFWFFSTGLAYNAHLGGRMVYEKGAGVDVKNAIQEIQNDSKNSDNE